MGRPDVWTYLPDGLPAGSVAGGRLAGARVAVKDNIDVAGMPTTAACPSFAYRPAVDAACVAALRAAGAVIIGKTNMDQFATGLVGTRSPSFGVVADAADPSMVSGGSSSGSAVAVALGLCDLALGTDTAGSGRVPAAFQGVVGFKPSIGRISVEGVVPACRSFDCVSVFAATVTAAERAVEVMTDPSFADSVPAVGANSAQFAVWPDEALSELSDGYRHAYADVVRSVDAAPIDPAPFINAGRLLYEGAFVAERYAAVGAFIEAADPGEIDPAVRQLILSAKPITAADYIADVQRLQRYRAEAYDQLQGVDALLLPTAPFQPTIAQVQADPIEINRRLGTYTTFCNLLGLCAVAVPAGRTPDGGHFGVTLYGRHGHDASIAALARRLIGDAEPWTVAPAPTNAFEQPSTGIVELLVLGAHLRGQPLNGQLTERGAALVAEAKTAPGYRLYALDTEPPKPGLVRDPELTAGGGIVGELWAIPRDGLATLLEQLPSPMALGAVTLSTGRSVVGFLCEPAALQGATEITDYGGWRSYLDR